MRWFVCPRRSSSKRLLRCAISLRRRTYFKSLLNLWLLNLPKRSVQHPEKSFTLDYAFIFSGMVRHCLWKLFVTPGACINETGLFSSAAVVPQSKYPSCVTRRPFGVTQSKSAELIARRPLRHKVNLPSCAARRRHFIMTRDIFGTGQTSI